ncbi:MAG: hypothetical protein JWO48_3667 [Bryobacterales bacterium]|nr:hypothetical protein [Bryobacterales bacterium]
MTEKTPGPVPIQNTNGAHLVDLTKSAPSVNLSAVLAAPPVPVAPAAPATSSNGTSSGQGASKGK